MLFLNLRFFGLHYLHTFSFFNEKDFFFINVLTEESFALFQDHRRIVFRIKQFCLVERCYKVKAHFQSRRREDSTKPQTK